MPANIPGQTQETPTVSIRVDYTTPYRFDSNGGAYRHDLNVGWVYRFRYTIYARTRPRQAHSLNVATSPVIWRRNSAGGIRPSESFGRPSLQLISRAAPQVSDPAQAGEQIGV